MEQTEQLQDALLLVHLRNQFYRAKYHAMTGIFLLSVLINLVLAGVIIFLVKHPTHPLYFVTDEVGRLIEDIPLNQPNMPAADVINWVTEALEATFSYDYVNYRGELQNAQKYLLTMEGVIT